MRKLLAVVSVVAAAGLLAAPATARVDRSFGDGGVVQVRPPLPPSGAGQLIEGLAGARDGSSYALFWRGGCETSRPCVDDRGYVLYRYRPDGSLDRGFGGPDGSFRLATDQQVAVRLAVDSSGRPLLSETDEPGGGTIYITRLTTSGRLDRSFGQRGRATVVCGCEAGRLIPGPRETLAVAVGGPIYGGGRSGIQVTVFRLAADGTRVDRFGSRGKATVALKGAGFFSAAGFRGETLYLAGNGCCGLGVGHYVARISAKGRLDTRFSAAARHALRVTRRLKGYSSRLSSLVLRPGGKIDVLGEVGYQRGYMVRLDRDGKLDTGFGSRGLRWLPVPVAAAALGGEGTVLAVGTRIPGVDLALMRILPGGRPDPAFGDSGEAVPGGGPGNGGNVVAVRGGRALVLDVGREACRSYCPPKPRLAMFLVGSRR